MDIKKKKAPLVPEKLVLKVLCSIHIRLDMLSLETEKSPVLLKHRRVYEASGSFGLKTFTRQLIRDCKESFKLSSKLQLSSFCLFSVTTDSAIKFYLKNL